jgi:iron(III) transport system ATP-binding protein
MSAIALVGIGKDYGSTTAVRSIDLEIPSGALYFLLGPSGCGKTTLLRMIAGFIEPTRGRILFGNREVTNVPPNDRNAGMVFQSYALWPHMTVLENVTFGLEVRKLPKEERLRRATSALERVRMGEYAQRRPNQLSGGQQQRVALARALAIEPTVLLLDEPLSNLDAKLRLAMRSEIRGLVTGLGITTVYVTHDQKEALSMADEVAVLRNGAIVQQGPPEELYRHPRSRFVADFLGETNFVDGTLLRIAPEGATVATAAGELLATLDPTAGSETLRAGSSVVLSIRPEAVRLIEPQEAPSGANLLRGRRASTMYLGDAAQHVIELDGGALLKVHEHNPRSQPPRDPSLAIAAQDVVVLHGEGAAAD